VARLDAIFTALAHPARRAMLARLSKGSSLMNGDFNLVLELV
jgi:DNA-binding transcriptional ArsR family regulator